MTARTAMRSSEGFTLIEVMVAFLILLIGSLALLRVTVMSIDGNMTNVLRDEGVRIADERMSVLRNLPFSDGKLAVHDWTLRDEGGAANPVKRDFRGLSRDYYVFTKVDNLDAAATSKRVQVAVGWNYKGAGTVNPTKQQYQHSISSVITQAP